MLVTSSCLCFVITLRRRKNFLFFVIFRTRWHPLWRGHSSEQWMRVCVGCKIIIHCFSPRCYTEKTRFHTLKVITGAACRTHLSTFTSGRVCAFKKKKKKHGKEVHESVEMSFSSGQDVTGFIVWPRSTFVQSCSERPWFLMQCCLATQTQNLRLSVFVSLWLSVSLTAWLFHRFWPDSLRGTRGPQLWL